jgi:hypothetical protein
MTTSAWGSPAGCAGRLVTHRPAGWTSLHGRSESDRPCTLPHLDEGMSGLSIRKTWLQLIVLSRIKNSCPYSPIDCSAQHQARQIHDEDFRGVH